MTIRTYWSAAEAGLAKSLLDNYQIPCVLLDENASLYNRGAQFAVPIRLSVDDRDADRAILLLNGDFENATEIDTNDKTVIDEALATEIANRNPWELLVMAFFFFLPGICGLQIKYPSMVGPSRSMDRTMADVRILHLFGWMAMIFAVILVAAYFYLRSGRAKPEPEHLG